MRMPLVMQICRAIGLAPFGYRYYSGGEYRYHRSSAWLAYSYLLLVSTGAHGTRWCYEWFFGSITFGDVSRLAKLFVLSSQLAFCNVVFFACWRQFPRLLRLLNQPVLSEKTSFEWTLCLCYLVPISELIWTIVTKADSDRILLGIRCYMLAVMVSIELLTTYMLHLARLRLQRINLSLVSLIASSETSLAWRKTDVHLSHKIQALRREHLEVVDVIGDICTCFQSQLLGVLLKDYIFTVIYSYTIIVILFKLTTEYLADNIYWVSVVLATHIPPSLYTILVAHWTGAEGRKTSDVVHCYLNSDYLSDAERQELKVFSMQLTHQRVEVNLLGLVSLDSQLIATGVGLLVTYLVILIQFVAVL